LSSRKPKKDSGYEIKIVMIVGFKPFVKKSIINPNKEEIIKAIPPLLGFGT
tara:strand:+ start:45 stop:197 length:153 start_codon:yes stop_codon:yes gene_type:complete